MPDRPDYSEYLGGSVRFSLQDMGELAARLGSIDLFDRRGEVIWIDDFTHALTNWFLYAQGANASVKMVTSPTYLTPYSVQMTTATDGLKRNGMTKYFSGVPATKLGFETGIQVINNPSYMLFNLSSQAPTGNFGMRVKLDYTDGHFYVQTTGGVYVITDAVSDLGKTYNYFMPVKFVADFETGYYTRIITPSGETDISTIPMVTITPSTNPLFSLTMELGSNNAGQAIMYNSYVIITNNDE